MIYNTLVFDFDGTIADTLGETRHIFNRIAPEYGIRQVEEHEIAALRHLSLKELLAHLDIPKRRVPALIARGTGMMRSNITRALIARGTGMMRSNITRLQLIPGMLDVIREMRRHVRQFGILTSNATPNVELFLKSHGLRDQFDFISSTSKLTGKSKHLRAIRKTFSLRSEELLFIGDELRDVRAAQKAGVPVAAVTWGFNSHEALAASLPDHLFDAPQDFLRLLAPR